jgi:hypothetical protein
MSERKQQGRKTSVRARAKLGGASPSEFSLSRRALETLLPAACLRSSLCLRDQRKVGSIILDLSAEAIIDQPVGQCENNKKSDPRGIIWLHAQTAQSQKARRRDVHKGASGG